MSNNARLQKGTYSDIRTRFTLPSQMTCSVIRDVAASYKGLWTKLMKNLEQRKAGSTKKRFKGLDKAPKFVSPTLMYHYGHDYSFKKGQFVSLLTLAGRVILPYDGYKKHFQYLLDGAEVGGARLWYDQPHQQFYLLVTIEVERPDPTPEQHPQIIGVDVGVRYLAVTSDYKGKATFHSGKSVRARANHYARLQRYAEVRWMPEASPRLSSGGN